ncbi:hypothetical protein [Dokdonella sp.]|uniref:hypothetical protein n=1 Tax=Dokdonella sp. TaxID=2291710 RepID=UPI002F40F52F
MSLPRTRNRALASALAGCAALLLGAFASPAGALSVRLESTGSGLRIGLVGQAPARCLPAVARVTVDGDDVGVMLHAPATGCARGTIAYALHVDPSMSGTPLSAGRTYRVSVFSDATDLPGLVAFRVLDTSASSAGAPQPENGFWWSEAALETGPASRSTGISLEAQGDQLAVSLFGFGDDGSPVWYFGSARRKGRIAVVPLLELRNGDPLFSPTGSRPSAIEGLRLELDFLSPSRARAWLVRSDDRRDIAVRALALSRSSFSNADGAEWSGRWILVGDDEATLRQFEFGAPTRRDAGALHYVAADGASLDCRSAPLASAPDFCTLSLGASAVADFDQVGLDRLDGRDGNGARVQLLRVRR